MTLDSSDGAVGFADLGLADELVAALDRPRLRGADADPARGDPAAARRAATCSARRRRAPARRPRSRCRCCSGSAAAPTVGRAPAALVLVPTRELAMQVAEAMHRYGRDARRARAADLRRPADRAASSARSSAASTSSSPRRAARSTTSAAGRSSSTASRSSCSTRPTRCSTWASPRTSRRSSTATPDDRQTVLFSATMPPRIDGDRRRAPARPGARSRSARERRRAGRGAARAPERLHRRRARTSPPRSAACSTSRRRRPRIVFCRTRDEVDQLTETLNGRGYRAEALHGGMTQEQRDRVDGPAARRHRRPAGRHRRRRPRPRHRRSSPTSSTTTCPSAPEAYVHRIGRVGRAGREGVAITLAEPREHRLLQDIERRHAGSRSRSRRSRRSPTCAPAGWSSRAPRCARVAARGRPRPLPRRRRGARRRVRRDGRRRGRGQARPRRRGPPTADEEEIPDVAAAPSARAGRRPRMAGVVARGATRRRWTGGRLREGREGDRPARRRPAGAPRAAGDGPERGTTRLFIGAGRSAGIRPQDLVGAITGESRLAGGTSARSRSPTASRWSRCRRPRPSRVITRAARAHDKGKKRRCAASGSTPSRGHRAS